MVRQKQNWIRRKTVHYLATAKKNHNDDELMQMQMTLLLFMAVLIIQIDRQQRDEHRDKC